MMMSRRSTYVSSTNINNISSANLKKNNDNLPNDTNVVDNDLSSHSWAYIFDRERVKRNLFPNLLGNARVDTLEPPSPYWKEYVKRRGETNDGSSTTSSQISGPQYYILPNSTFRNVSGKRLKRHNSQSVLKTLETALKSYQSDITQTKSVYESNDLTPETSPIKRTLRNSVKNVPDTRASAKKSNNESFQMSQEKTRRQSPQNLSQSSGNVSMSNQTTNISPIKSAVTPSPTNKVRTSNNKNILQFPKLSTSSSKDKIDKQKQKEDLQPRLTRTSSPKIVNQKPTSTPSVAKGKADKNLKLKIRKRKFLKTSVVSGPSKTQPGSMLLRGSRKTEDSRSDRSDLSLGDICDFESEASTDVLERFPEIKSAIEERLVLINASYSVSSPSVTKRLNPGSLFHLLPMYSTQGIPNQPESIQPKLKKPARPINPDRIYNGKEYKNPRLAMPAPWINKRLYRKVTVAFSNNLEEFDFVSNAEVEKYILKLHELVKDVLHHKPSKQNRNGDDKVLAVMTHLYSVGLIKCKMQFLKFCKDYLPGEFLSRGMFYPFPDGPNIPVKEHGQHRSANYLFEDLKLC